jgi:hypothetical protein
MATQLLIYERAVPVSQQRHRDWYIKTGTDYGFAGKVNSVPLVAAEVTIAAQIYPIVFAGDRDVVPVTLLGVRDGENLFVGKDGAWDAKYIPAFVRRYPFVFSSTDDGQTFTLCLDEDFSGVNTEGKGERLFDTEGERTQYLKNVLNFLQVYQAQFQRTQALCKKLADLDLFEPMQAQVRLKSGQQLTLGGFKVVNRDKLKALPAETLGEMAKLDELEVIYAHIASLRNFGPMVERMGASGVAEQAPAEPAAV